MIYSRQIKDMNDKNTDEHLYDDMLLIQHHTSEKHIHMSLNQRAAQFLPYKSLAGFEQKIEEIEAIYLKSYE